MRRGEPFAPPQPSPTSGRITPARSRGDRPVAPTSLLLVLLLLLSLAAPVAGKQAITVVSNTATNAFPQRITFSLEVEASNLLEQVALYYRTAGSEAISYVRPEYQPGRKVTVEHVWNVQRIYIPPGTEIDYYWVARDSEGNSLRTETRRVVAEDVRFRWERLAVGNLELYWYRGDQRLAQTLMDAALDAVATLGQDVGVEITERVKILVYGSQQEMLGALEPGAHEWTGGRTFPEESIIVAAVSPTEDGLQYGLRIVRHELSHVALYQATKNPYSDIPHWLDEGLATLAEGTTDPAYSTALELAIQENRLISLNSLSSNFPADPDLALLSYAESYSVVQFMLHQYGRQKMAQLLELFRQGATYDDALEQALGVDVAGLDALWRASLGMELPVATTPSDVGVTPQPAGSPTATPQVEAMPTPSRAGAGVCGEPLLLIGLLGAGLGLAWWLRRQTSKGSASRL